MDLCLGTAVSVCYLTYEGLCVCGMCVSVCVCVSVSSLCVCVVGSSVSAWPFSAPGKVAPADPRPGQPLRTWPCSPGSAQAQVLRPHPWRPACPKGPFLSLHKAEPQLIPTSMEMPFLGFPTLPTHLHRVPSAHLRILLTHHTPVLVQPPPSCRAPAFQQCTPGATPGHLVIFLQTPGPSPAAPAPSRAEPRLGQREPASALLLPYSAHTPGLLRSRTLCPAPEVRA